MCKLIWNKSVQTGPPYYGRYFTPLWHLYVTAIRSTLSSFLHSWQRRFIITKSYLTTAHLTAQHRKQSSHRPSCNSGHTSLVGESSKNKHSRKKYFLPGASRLRHRPPAAKRLRSIVRLPWGTRRVRRRDASAVSVAATRMRARVR